MLTVTLKSGTLKKIGLNVLEFLNWTHKILLIGRQQYDFFSKIAKNAKLLHPNLHLTEKTEFPGGKCNQQVTFVIYFIII